MASLTTKPSSTAVPTQINIEAMAAAFGATVAFGVSLFVLRFVEEVELLLVLSLLLTGLVYAGLEAFRWYALANDGAIDLFERVGIATLTFFYTLLFFSSVQYAIRLGSDALEAFPLPATEDFLLLLGVILLLVFAAFPFFVNVATAPPGKQKDA
jgi:hypothetical protein